MNILLWIRIINELEVHSESTSTSFIDTMVILSPCIQVIGETPSFARQRPCRDPVDWHHSLERLHAYSTIEREPQAISRREPPAYWPGSGELRVENLSARYSIDGPRVLHNLSFTIEAGQRIGVGEPS